MHIVLNNFSQAQIFKGWMALPLYPMDKSLSFGKLKINIWFWYQYSTCLMVSGDLFTNTVQPLNNWGF